MDDLRPEKPNPLSRDPLLARLAMQVVLRSVRAVLNVSSYVLLLPRPSLFSAWVELRRLRHCQDTAEDKEFDAVLARQRHGQKVRELCYVDTPASLGLFLCLWAGVRRSSSVFDVGAGRGALLIAARAFGAEARGVELLKSRVEPAAAVIKAVGAELFDGDAADQDLFGVTHVLCTWTALSTDTRDRIQGDLLRLEARARVLVFTHPMEQDGFRLLRRCFVPVPWGLDIVYLYERLAED